MILHQPLPTIVQQMKSQEFDSSDQARPEDREEMRDEMLEKTKGMGSDFSSYHLDLRLIQGIWSPYYGPYFIMTIVVSHYL